MRIRDYSATLEEKMSEFDLWVTPSLGEIRDTDQFKNNLNGLKHGFELLSIISDGFINLSSCAASNLAERAVELIKDESNENATAILNSICNVLLLATGKTDNNLKCQFPLRLKNDLGIHTYPQRSAKGQYIDKPVPRTLGLDDVTKLIVHMKGKNEFQELFTKTYFQLILSDEAYSNQLWSLGTAYTVLKAQGNADSLISSIVVFQSRGSITATQGHIPENILRQYLADWGLVSGYDYNTQDVSLGDFLDGIETDDRIKKRKYDFIIPFQSRKSGKKVFIQSQFYAGDSGSVSHKVVDQTDSTRSVTLRKYPQAVFLEYLDGAGYYSSLNGDLRKMLAKKTTKDFFQIRTAPVKLRRELQGIEFLTTLEIEHAIIRSSGRSVDVSAILQSEGYSESEIKTAIENAIKHNIICENSTDRFELQKSRIPIIRRYCLLDLLANFGQPIPSDKAKGKLIIPGFEILWGLPQNQLIQIAIQEIPKLKELWANVVVEPFNDVQWLLEKEFVVLK